ncbi:MAG: hypothetical protein HY841_04825, partial [Bacteroidetes bacterium]|nr:hypothetical protein [Bacteroidota bacterium]
MKNKFLLLLAVLFTNFLSAQTITVVSPNGAENWTSCSVRTITWTQSGTSGFFNVEYSTNNGTSWSSLATNYSGLSFSWTLSNLNTSQALVRVYDYNNNLITDQSNAVFTITPALTVTAPNGGESWQVGAGTKNITWDGFGTSNSFLLEYSINGGSTYTTITSATFTPVGNAYTYVWTIPNNPSVSCLVRITDNGSPSCKTDASDNLFTIAPPTPIITVTAPNGGNTLYIAQNFNITWTSAYLSGSFVKIEYSSDNGSTWTTVINSTNNSGSYLWTNIPNAPSSVCLVKISDAGFPATYDVSNAVFTIAIGTITVTSPNGAENWTGCSVRSITWSQTGTSGFFNVEYSTNNGVSWSSLATNYSGSSFSWTVPNISTTQALVRVTDYNNNAITDNSNAVFTITSAVIVTAPNGGETWQGGTTHLITWTQGTVASNWWTIRYSLDAGTTWTNIINNVNITTGQYNWLVPNTPSTQCLIQVYDYNNSSCVTDKSDNLFTITLATPVITVTTPNGGNTFYVAGNYSINWTYQYVVGSFVTIEYSINNGAT